MATEVLRPQEAEHGGGPMHGMLGPAMEGFVADDEPLPKPINKLTTNSECPVWGRMCKKFYGINNYRGFRRMQVRHFQLRVVSSNDLPA